MVRTRRAQEPVCGAKDATSKHRASRQDDGLKGSSPDQGKNAKDMK